MSIKLLHRQATIQESKCLEIVFERGKMVRGDRLEVLKGRMKTVDLDEYEIYKFLGDRTGGWDQNQESL